ncbi:MAG TPA: iron-containing alcohol dehydrogenase [Solirubrobacterales bacterium]|nr:iron-containing alcohol dehydrogenase [Solirubrobacterales bacterium]
MADLPDAAAIDTAFTWRDGERLTVFRAGVLADAAAELEENGWGRYELLTTPRALATAAVELPGRAHAVHEVPPGPVPEAAAAVIGAVEVPTLVALGGGRVIDAAKAIAAVRGGRAAAIPTTLSGAEMTRIHRFPSGYEAPHRVRPELVLADPEPMTSLPEDDLRASAINAISHGIEPLYAPGRNPVATLAALHGIELCCSALDQPPGERDRPALALGSLLCAYALDSAGLGLHHVVCQSLVRTMAIPHAKAYATMLPRTIGAIAAREPEAIAAVADAIGVRPERLAARLEELGGGPRRLVDIGADPSAVGAAVDAMLARAELRESAEPPSREELVALVESAL